MSRLKRLLYDPDTLRWRKYKQNLLKANVRFTGILLFFLIVIPVATLAYYYIQIENTRIKELPQNYQMVSLHQVYQIVQPIALEWRQDAYLSFGSFEVFPNWGFHKEPLVRLIFISPKDEASLLIMITEIYGDFEILVFDFSLPSWETQYKIYVYGNNHANISDTVTESVNNTEIFNLILNNGANDFIIEKKFVYWPTLLQFKNSSKSLEHFIPSWELCFGEAHHPSGELVCFGDSE